MADQSARRKIITWLLGRDPVQKLVLPTVLPKANVVPIRKEQSIFTAEDIIEPNRSASARSIDYTEKCRCGHYRYEHHGHWGCMQWDERRLKGWCNCDGFAVRRAL